MSRNKGAPAGRLFVHLPGPTNIPDRILGAMHQQVIDFQSPDFLDLQAECLTGLQTVLRTDGAVFAYAATGHGAWEAAISNIFSPDETVLIPETGFFSQAWGAMCREFGLTVETVPSDWRVALDPAAVEQRLREDRAHAIKGVCVVHNETSTGIRHDVAGVRRALDAAGHPALLLVDTISSLGSMEFRMDDWGVDVAVCGSQKGLMLPVGLGINAASARAMLAAEAATGRRRYFDWRGREPSDGQLCFMGTAPVHMFYALREGLRMLQAEGLEAVFARHARLAEAVRRAVAVWSEGGGPAFFARNPADRSNSVTALLMPDGHEPERFREICLADCNLALGGGLGKLEGRVFRIGHLGDLNEAMILGALGTVEINLARQGIPHTPGGAQAAVTWLAGN